jgi:hypothetical protein
MVRMIFSTVRAPHQADLAAADPGGSGDHAIGGQAVGQTVGIEAVLDERAVVDQQGDALAGEELALGGVRGVVALGAPGQHALARLRQRLLVDGQGSSLRGSPNSGSPEQWIACKTDRLNDR